VSREMSLYLRLMANEIDLYTLTEMISDLRDENWEHQLLKALPHGQFHLLNVEPQQGPDGWPYLLVQAHPEGGESMTQLLPWLVEKGVGLAINPHKDTPDYVLTYGMVWNFKERRQFLSDIDLAKVPHPGQVQLRKDQKIISGEPSEEYWPGYSRGIVRDFLKQNGVNEAKVLVLSQDGQHYDLCFSFESFGQPPQSEHKGILEALSWFFPAHYSLMLISENGLPPFSNI
jgi:hypothetical protein